MTTDQIIGFTSLLIAVPSLIFAFKQYARETPSNIIFMIDEEINLYNSITKNLDELEIYYQKKIIEPNTYLLKAYIYYNGQKDITKDSIIRGIFFALPNNSIIYQCNIFDKTIGLDLKTIIIDNNIEFKVDILKKGDYFKFQLLAKVNFDDKKEDYKFMPNHRIANISKIKRIYTWRANTLKELIFIIIPFLASIIFLLYRFISSGSGPIVETIIYSDKKIIYSGDDPINALFEIDINNKRKLINYINKYSKKIHASMKDTSLNYHFDYYNNSISLLNYGNPYKIMHRIDSLRNSYQNNKITDFFMEKETEIIKLNSKYSVKYKYSINFEFIGVVFLYCLILFLLIVLIIIGYDSYSYSGILKKINNKDN